MFYQIFFSSQVKQSVIISNKHGLYTTNDLTNKKTSNLRKSRNVREIFNFDRIIA